jgi:hypothetical protein
MYIYIPGVNLVYTVLNACIQYIRGQSQVYTGIYIYIYQVYDGSFSMLCHMARPFPMLYKLRRRAEVDRMYKETTQ